MEHLPHLVILVGPTAVGKTDFSIRLAQRVNAEIISADSRLFYRGMDIGTAKPSEEERQAVIHHLIDVADPDEIWSLQHFQKEATSTIEAVHSHGKLPLLVGGTGQYIRAVVQGWLGPEVPPNLVMREALENWARDLGSPGLHTRLSKLDPTAAAAIDPNNLRRVVRALEVIFSTGKQFSVQRRQGENRYRTLTIGLHRPRAEIYQRIDERIEAMFSAGFVEEVSKLLLKGLAPDHPNLSAIGYRDVIAFLQGRISLDDAKANMRRQTRVFVRRQANWFNPNDPDILWLPASDAGEQGSSATLLAAESAINRFLQNS